MAKATKETYDIDQSASIGRKALEKLRAEKRPGEGARGTKTDVLTALKAEMAALLREGYTASQIADALAEGGLFTAQPKTIAEVAGVSARKPSSRRTGTPQPRHDQARDYNSGQSHVKTDDDAHGKTKEQPAPTHEKGSRIGDPPPPSAPQAHTERPIDKSTFTIKPDTKNL